MGEEVEAALAVLQAIVDLQRSDGDCAQAVGRQAADLQTAYRKTDRFAVLRVGARGIQGG